MKPGLVLRICLAANIVLLIAQSVFFAVTPDLFHGALLGVNVIGLGICTVVLIRLRPPPHYIARRRAGYHYMYEVVDTTNEAATFSWKEGLGSLDKRQARQEARRLNKEHRNESDRSTETDHQDSGTGTSTSTPASTGTLSYTGTFHPVPGRPSLTPTIETIEDTVPILAHRAARLIVTRDGITFAAINDNFGIFGRDADAQCRQSNQWGTSGSYGYYTTGNHHAGAPHLNCNCGFYGVPADIKAWHGPNTVDLLVELSGVVIEHEHGYRAEHQRVVECRLPACPFCARPSTIVGFVNGHGTHFTCDAHTNNDTVKVNRDDLSRVLGVPIGDES